MLKAAVERGLGHTGISRNPVGQGSENVRVGDLTLASGT